MFRCGEDDWDLQAVVRGCSTVSVTATSTNTAINHPLSSFPPLNIEDDPLTRFQSLLETTDALEELEQLYKPFVPKQRPLPPQSISKSPLSVLGGFTEQQQQLQQRRTQQQSQKQQPQRCLTGSAPASSTQAQTPRSKRRKNQQKKVVCQVPAEGLSSDMWAWRKYGQKPIKGSPYPRGYYRCSSSKGCLARKQVERSRSDPAMFVITYTAEHNHPVPTHRNSLAGSTRNKSSTPRTDTAGDPGTPTSKRSYPSSPNSTADLSPTTPSTTSMEDEYLHRTKQESREEEEETVAEDDEDDELLIPDVVMTDDLFMTLEELSGATSGFSATTTTTSSANGQAFDHCFPDHFGTTLPHPWFSNNAATAGGGS